MIGVGGLACGDWNEGNEVWFGLMIKSLVYESLFGFG